VRKAAWLYGQFIASKTVDVKKSHVGLTFIRESTIQHESFTERAPKLGGLDRVLPLAGARAVVADGHERAGLSASRAAVVAGDRRCVLGARRRPQEAMDTLCAEQEAVMERIQRSGVQGDLGPNLNEEHDLEYWVEQASANGTIAPQAKLENEDEQPMTITYDELIQSWQ
jgi:glycerol transport system substrate-binding protein